jgi:hypothetical protein
MPRSLALALLLLLSPATARADGGFQPVGLWRFFHTDGSAFLARLRPDQSATTDFGQGEVGIWRWEGDRVRLYYTDGYDVLYRRDGGFRKPDGPPVPTAAARRRTTPRPSICPPIPPRSRDPGSCCTCETT